MRIGSRLRIATLALLSLAAGVLTACGQPGRAPAPVVSPVAPLPADPSSRPVVAVERGDTLYGIARRHGISLRALIDLNRLDPPYRLLVGQVLTLPAGRDHLVGKGETLSGIARRYGVDVSALVRLNAVPPPYTIYPGQRLRLPSTRAATAGARDPQPAAKPVAASPEPTTVVILSPHMSGRGEQRTEARPMAVPSSPPPPPRQAAPPPPPAVQAVSAPPPVNPITVAPPALHSAGFTWPVRGEVISGFGPAGKGQHNDGINIAVPRGEPVRSAEGGVVVYAGEEMKGFGKLLLIKHADGWMTAYAHNDALLVGRGEVVERGQVVARAGSTGNVAEPQLHFEIRRGTRAVDPVQHLGDGRV